MNVAIVGAGLSGPACAIELKKYGIFPTIFEKRSKVGERLEIPAAALRIFDRDYKDPLQYFKREYELDISALSYVREIKMNSPGKEITVKGNLGYLFKRGTQEDSLENQLAKKAGLPIVFDTFIDVNKIKDDFDYIVVANGNTTVPRGLGLLTTTFSAQSRTAFIIGDFKTDAIIMWMNTEYSKNCYCYLCPVNGKEARLVMLVNNISHKELEYYWDKFLEIEKIPYKIIETRDLEHLIGTVNPVRYENLYFTGDSCGLVDNFLGFGALNAVESGLIAGRCIAGKHDYAECIQPFSDFIDILREYRKAMNYMDNKDFDMLLTLLGLPGIKQFVYRNPLFDVKKGYSVVKLFNRLRKKQLEEVFQI